MRTNRQKPKPGLRWRSEKKSIVYIVTMEDLKKMEVVGTHKSFTIYDHPSCISPNNRYEIIYNGSKNWFSLLRCESKERAEKYIRQMENIIPILTAGIVTPKPSVCQQVVETIVNNPEWKECHVAASIGCTTYFTNSKLLPKDINVVAEPGMVTPLHLAISRNFYETVRAILQLKPNISIVDDEGNNVLHEAASGSTEILNELLKMAGVEALFSSANAKSLTPVSIAFYQNKLANIKRFMLFGVPANLLYIGKPAPNKNDKIIKYDLKTLNSFDFSNISRGGCPLHWCKDAPAIAREIANEFVLDYLDLDMETPILVAMKKNLSKSVIILASNGANVSLADSQGNNPLHIATRRGDLYMIKSLLVFGADINQRNTYNESPLHIAASRGQASEEAYKLLLTMKPAACKKDLLKGCNKRCLEPCYLMYSIVEKCAFNTLHAQKGLYQKLMDKVDRKVSRIDSEELSRSRIDSEELPRSRMDSDEFLRYRTASENANVKRNRMLTIDGGGVKGLISIQTMIELESFLRLPIHNYFDWFCGTSTGAIIATALIQGKSLIEIRKLYWRFKDQVMSGKKPFDSDKLIKLFKEELMGELAIREMSKLFGKQLMITATNIRLHPPVLEMFRSFRNQQNITTVQETIEIWEALRASTAAPMFFKSHRKFVDGGLIANNPTIDALTEYTRHRDFILKHNEIEKNQRKVPQLDLVISLGQSRIRPEKNNLHKLYDSLNLSLVNLMRNAFPGTKFVCEIVNQIKSFVLQTNEYVVNRAEAFCTCWNTLFYRISPVIGFKMSLDETNDEKLIEALWSVKVYCIKNAAEFKEVADILNALGPAHKRFEEEIESGIISENSLKTISESIQGFQSKRLSRGESSSSLLRSAISKLNNKKD